MSSENNSDVRTIVIRNQRGLHARASAKFVSLAAQYEAQITVSKDGIDVCATSIMGLMMLAAAIGEEIVIRGKGEQKDEALDALETLVNERFGEEI